MKTKALRHSGFTISEIIIVFAVIVVLVALMIPNFTTKCGRNPKDSCISNLKIIDGAKQQWAVDNKKLAKDVPADSDIYEGTNYIRTKLLCPTGGSYSLHAVSASPTCSKSGAPDFHTL